MKALKAVGGIYNKLEEILLVTMLSGSLIILFLNVILRYVFNSSIYGADELARVLFIWMSWLGISIGERKSEHIRIDMLINKLKGVPKKTIIFLSNIITLGILLAIAYYGMGIVTTYMRKGVTTPMYSIPQALVFFSVPYSCTVMAVRLIVNSFDVVFREEDITEWGNAE